jgi:hypothetical protein
MPADPDRLAEIAVELAVRIRDDDPEANGRWLKAQLPNSADWFRLAFALAAAVPDDQSWTSLTDWARGLKPCGTHAAATRHRYRGEPLCNRCRQAEQARDRDRKRIERTVA